jgi:hypothetical protein
MVMVTALRRSGKKQSVSLHLCAQNADVSPVTQRDLLTRVMEHGDLLTCVNRHFLDSTVIALPFFRLSCC